MIDLKFSANILRGKKKSCLVISIHKKKLRGARQKESGGIEFHWGVERLKHNCFQKESKERCYTASSLLQHNYKLSITENIWQQSYGRK